MRSLALVLFALVTLAAGCGPQKPVPPSPAGTSAAAPVEPAPAPKPEAPPAPAAAPVDPLTGQPPEHLVKAYREGQLKLPEPPPLDTEKPDACRSPGEPGCAQCCERSEPTGCYGGEGSPEPPGNGSPPWFNVRGELSEGPCPADCKPCAKCTLRDEWELSQLRAADAQCDCTKPYPGVDHCYSPKSCGCICGRILGLTKRCPQLHPARAK